MPVNFSKIKLVNKKNKYFIVYDGDSIVNEGSEAVDKAMYEAVRRQVEAQGYEPVVVGNMTTFINKA